MSTLLIGVATVVTAVREVGGAAPDGARAAVAGGHPGIAFPHLLPIVGAAVLVVAAAVHRTGMVRSTAGGPGAAVLAGAELRRTLQDGFRRHPRSVAVMHVDLGRFTLRSQPGLPAGAEPAAVSAILGRALPPQGHLARLPGGELVLVLPDHTIDEALAVAAAVRRSVLAAADGPGGLGPPVALAILSGARVQPGVVLDEAEALVAHAARTAERHADPSCQER